MTLRSHICRLLLRVLPSSPHLAARADRNNGVKVEEAR